MGKTIEKFASVKVTPPGTLNWRDFANGLVMAILTPALVVVQQSVDKGELVFNWKVIAIAAISGGIAYLLKNLFTSSVREVK